MKRGMKSISSMSEIADYLNDTLKQRASDTVIAGIFMANKVSQISIFMQTTKGRDKICSLIQYSADLYEACIKNSNIPEIQKKYLEKKMVSFRVAQKIRENMKNGRKIFKFLKFFDSIHGIQKTMKRDRPLHYKAIMLITHTCNFFYYIIDHIIWGINIGVLTDVVSIQLKPQAKAAKDSFSLGKTMLKLIKVILDYKMIKNQEDLLAQEIYLLPNKRIVEDGIAFQSCKSLIRSREKRRIKQMNLLITILRITMLIKRLKIPGHLYINKIAYATFGMAITLMNIAIEFSEKPKIYEVKAMKEQKPKDDFQQFQREFTQKNQGSDSKIPRTSSQLFNQQKTMRKHKSDLEQILANDDSDND